MTRFLPPLARAAAIRLFREWCADAAEGLGKRLNVGRTAGGSEEGKDIGAGAAMDGPLAPAAGAFGVTVAFGVRVAFGLTGAMLFLWRHGDRRGVCARTGAPSAEPAPWALGGASDMRRAATGQKWSVPSFVVKVALGLAGFVCTPVPGVLFFAAHAVSFWRESHGDKGKGKGKGECHGALPWSGLITVAAISCLPLTTRAHRLTPGCLAVAAGFSVVLAPGLIPVLGCIPSRPGAGPLAPAARDPVSPCVTSSPPRCPRPAPRPDPRRPDDCVNMTDEHPSSAARPADGPPGPGRRHKAAPARAGTRRRKARGKPRGRRKLFLGIGAAVVVLALAAGGTLYLRLSGNIQTFDGKGLSHQRPKDTPGDAQNVLLIGSDSRSGGNAKLGGGKDAVGRSDTTILLHVYADHRHAVGVSIPRDSLVDIPPCRLPDGSWSQTRGNTMFNAAFTLGDTAAGNPACTQNTVEALTGLRVDHTVVVNFEGFASMTKAVGGVPVCLPGDIYAQDLNPKLPARGDLIYHKGEQKVSGKSALDYVRLRHGLGDGSDIGRTKRQQAFISSLIAQVKKEGFSPTTLLPLANSATKSLTVDPGLGSPSKLLSFAMSLKNIDLGDIKFLTVPWKYQGARVALVHPDADDLWATLKADRTLDGKATGKDKDKAGDGGKDEAAGGKEGASPSPSAETITGAGTTVAVYNGTTTPGLAARAADLLRAHQYSVSGTSTAVSQDHATTVVQYGDGLEERARHLAGLFPGAQLAPVPGLGGINLVTGRDYAASPGGTPTPVAPTPLPKSVTDQARSADRNICSDLSYG